MFKNDLLVGVLHKVKLYGKKVDRLKIWKDKKIFASTNLSQNLITEFLFTFLT